MPGEVKVAGEEEPKWKHVYALDKGHLPPRCLALL